MAYGRSLTFWEYKAKLVPLRSEQRARNIHAEREIQVRFISRNIDLISLRDLPQPAPRPPGSHRKPSARHSLGLRREQPADRAVAA